MSRKVTIHLEGLEELKVTINNSHGRAANQALKVVKNNTELLKKTAQSLAPVDTYFLHDNIKAMYEGMTGEVRANAAYSGYQEYGTRFMAAQPYMRPAAWEVQELFKRDMSDVLKGVFK